MGAVTADRPYDRLLLVVPAALVLLGIFMVYSTTAVVTHLEATRSAAYLGYVKKQLATVVLGVIAMAVAARIDLGFVRRAAPWLLALSFVLLGLVFVPGIGVKAGGASRWIRLWPTTFQPSELAKLAMVIFVSAQVADERTRPSQFFGFAVPVCVMLVLQGIFLRQPDFGAAMSLGVITVSMLFLAGARLRYLGALFLCALPAVAVLAREPYRWIRLTAFVDPWRYAETIGFQLVQSFLAFGRGGVAGVGLGQSMQKLDYLPEVHTDFIFSVVGEELGFVRAVVVVGLFALLFWRGVRVALKTEDPFSYYLAFGLSVMIALQAVVNFYVVTGLLPTKGLPLPFLSYGGSSLLINMTAVGLLLNLSRGVRKVAGRADTLDAVLRAKKARRAVYGRGI